MWADWRTDGKEKIEGDGKAAVKGTRAGCYPGRPCQARRVNVRLRGAGAENRPRPHLLAAAAAANAAAGNTVLRWERVQGVLLRPSWLATMGWRGSEEMSEMGGGRSLEEAAGVGCEVGRGLPAGFGEGCSAGVHHRRYRRRSTSPAQLGVPGRERCHEGNAVADVR